MDLSKVYSPDIERPTNIVKGESDPLKRYEDGAYCKNYYFEQISKNTDIYKEDFYFGHSMYLNAIEMTFGSVISSAKAKIYDISCQDTNKSFP